MSGSNPNPYFDMNWKQFEQFFGGKMPFPPQPGSGDTGPAAAAGDLSWVDGYIKDVLKKTIPQMEVQTLNHHFHSEVFDTHNNVIVKVHIPDRAQARKIRVLLNTDQLRLEGLPDDKTQTIGLPGFIVPSSCKAVYKNGILQLHMRKQTTENPFYEIDVRFT
ncbi:Hsp20/alpha crystallin family protein [Paenibacillus validus]|uniref:Hsp20/alpha crystallin family protein n=1 Tax=Paenibacillus validus TaxID=44253 RepID=A0A7X2ZD53_9BACL|nr:MULTISPECIES: Hsp20/alpha crystallin family protein [Paenibacillus]MED4600171.1 Hsp20/alpha crystallin family protein [Paenibacillus validus]MED4607657.1 Hsp20/alpha crystallin family protein [Paenibacillus validus]MUG72662.1 hypothetical protein [Paenibacillus validus]